MRHPVNNRVMGKGAGKYAADFFHIGGTSGGDIVFEGDLVRK